MGQVNVSIIGLIEHGAVDFFTPGFPFLGGQLARDVDGIAHADGAFAEGEGYLEAVPAFEGVLPGQVVADGQDGQTGGLGHGDRAGMDAVAGTSGTVGSDGQIQSLGGPGVELDQGLASAPAAGAADGLDVIHLQHMRKDAAVPAGADQCRHAPRGLTFHGKEKVQSQTEEQPVVPDAEDDRLRSARRVKDLHVVALGMQAEPDGGREQPGDPVDQVSRDAPVPLRFLGNDSIGGGWRGSRHGRGLFFQTGADDLFHGRAGTQHSLSGLDRGERVRLFESQSDQCRQGIVQGLIHDSRRKRDRAAAAA